VGTRNPGQQALLVSAYLRKGETFAQLAAGFGIGTTTAWRYANETAGPLAARAPKLRTAIRAAGSGHSRRRYEALVYRRGPGQCAFWLGAISSTGHGKFRAGSRARGRPETGPSRIVTAHVYAYQLRHGALPAAEARQVVIRHTCDETSCQAWEHLIIGTQPDNVWDYQARRGREGGPLADRRGPRSP
jgi:hypothetical protein